MLLQMRMIINNYSLLNTSFSPLGFWVTAGAALKWSKQAITWAAWHWRSTIIEATKVSPIIYSIDYFETLSNH